MYSNSSTIQRFSRGSSRGITYTNAYKNMGPTYNSSIKKSQNNNQQSGILKNSSKQSYEVAMKNSIKQQNSRNATYNYSNYNYHHGSSVLRQRQKQKEAKYGIIANTKDSDLKLDSKDSRYQQFRIRSNVKQNMANSRKTQKDQEQRQLQKQKDLQESRRRNQQIKRQRERQEQYNYQKIIKQKQAQLQKQRAEQRQRQRQRQRQKQRQRQRQKQRQKQRERQRQKQRQKQRQRQRKQTLLGRRQSNNIDNYHKKTDTTDSKQHLSMNNSTTTGASDNSVSSARNGAQSNFNFNNSYGYSTSSSKTIGLVGLNNIGNTCFMNSILQCVFNLPGFNEYFLAGKHDHQMKSGARVAEAYARTIKTMRNSTSRSQTPSELKSAIGAKRSRFMGYSQQDAQQFLAALLQLLSLDLNRAKNPKYKELTADLSKQSLKQISDDWWNYNKQRQDSIVCDFFSGQVLSRVVCSKCKNQSIAFDNIMDMALDFSPNDKGDILRMIENFLKEQTIADDYYCSKCKAFRPCQRKIDFYRLPKILVLQLKRFSYGKYRKVKLNNRVKVQTTLDLSSLITESNHQSVKSPVYNLVGVVNHSGDIDFGHYTAQCRNPINGKWYDFNDSSVHQIRMKQDFQSSSPYVLFYAKTNL